MSSMNSMFTISNTTQKAPPSLPFKKIKEDILGTTYSVSLVFIGTKRAKTLNTVWRKKEYIPNVLAFEVDNNTAEIYITPDIAAKEAKKYDHSEAAHIGYLFIHALLHLKGHAHGVTMESQEVAYMKKYTLS